MGTPHDDRRAQAKAVTERLRGEYPDATISVRFSNRLELLVAVVLSGQCTDERVNAVTADLFEKYETAADYANVAPEELAEDIGSVTYPNQKAGWLTDAAAILLEDHDGEVPDEMEALTDLPGVGRKTANVVLQHGHDVVEGVVVDTHVQRLAQRLGIVETDDRDRIETALMDLLPEDDWQQFTHLCIAHGRAVCTARNPECEACVLEDCCPSSKLDHDVDLASGEAW